jgi:hypothetical protein
MEEEEEKGWGEGVLGGRPRVCLTETDSSETDSWREAKSLSH